MKAHCEHWGLTQWADVRLLAVSGKQVSWEQKKDSQVFQRKRRKSPGANLHNIVVAKVQRLQSDQRTEPLRRDPRDPVVCSENTSRGIQKQISAHRWRAPLHASQQPLGSEACYLVYKVITNKVFKQKIPLPITRMMKPIPSVKAPLTSPAISRAARLLNCSAGAACVRNTEGTEPPLCVRRAENIPWNHRSKPSDSHTHTRFEFTQLNERNST